MPVGTYIIGTEPVDAALAERLLPGDVAACDNNFVLDYFRFSADHRMLFGGRVSYTTMTPPNLKEVMRIDENSAGDKSGEFFRKTRDGKQILRDVMKGFIPEDVTRAEKQGFSAPDSSWFKGESIQFVRDTLLRPDARVYELLDREAVQRLVNQHLDGEHNRRLLIWSLLNVEQWLAAN
jgi:asparagine synthetase B (glutamine-hydrolysing)